jgi:hypothetical protein
MVRLKVVMTDGPYILNIYSIIWKMEVEVKGKVILGLN